MATSTTRTRTLTVNACKYVRITNTNTYKHEKLVSIAGYSMTMTFQNYNDPNRATPSCRKGDYGQMQTRHFMKNGILYFYTGFSKGTKVKVVYQK